MIDLYSGVLMLRPVTMDMSARQLRLLTMTSESTDGVTVRDASAAMTKGDVRVSKPAITRGADKLAALGLIKRFDDPKDKRSVFIRITKDGRKLLKDINGDIAKAQRAVTKRLASEAAPIAA